MEWKITLITHEDAIKEVWKLAACPKYDKQLYCPPRCEKRTLACRPRCEKRTLACLLKYNWCTNHYIHRIKERCQAITSDQAPKEVAYLLLVAWCYSVAHDRSGVYLGRVASRRVAPVCYWWLKYIDFFWGDLDRVASRRVASRRVALVCYRPNWGLVACDR